MRILPFVVYYGAIGVNIRRNLGVEFGEYSLKQYRYAKEYYRIVKEMLEERGMCLCTK